MIYQHHIFYSVITQPLVLGVPFNYAIFIFVLAAVLQLYIGAFIGISVTAAIFIFSLFLYIIGILFTRKDKNWFELCLVSLKFSAKNFFLRKINYVA